jgi:hypothetical protein
MTTATYEERHLPAGALDADLLAVLADGLPRDARPPEGQCRCQDRDAERGQRACPTPAGHSASPVFQLIECTFTATGAIGGGWGKKNARLVR